MRETQGLSGDVDQDKMTAIFRKRASDLAGSRIGQSKKDDDIPALMFDIGNERYAFALEDLVGVFPCDHCTPLPTSDKIICGIINIRGDLHCVVELSALMGMDLPEGKEKGYVLIVKQTGLGLKVPQVDQILDLREKDRAGSALKLYEIPGEYAKALFQETIVLLDVQKIIDHPLLKNKQR